MTLTQLRSFIAVARHGGFTAAGRALGISQTTLTSQIQTLEEEHSVELFHRRGRRVELSATGNEFLQLARQIVGLEDDAKLLLEDSGQLQRGTLRIGAVGPFHVTEMIAAYHALYPGIYLTMTLGNSESVLRDLDRYACDIGIVAKRGHNDRYYTQSYASYPVIAFVNRKHPFAQRKSVDLKDLSQEPLLMREAGSTTRKALEEALHARSLAPRIAMEIGSREALREAVARGLGVGTVSESEYIPDARLCPVAIKGNPVVTHIHVCCLRERRKSRSVASFFEAVKHARRGE